MSSVYDRQKWLEHEILTVATTILALGFEGDAAALGICAQHARRIAEEIRDMETIEEGAFIPPRRVDNMRAVLHVVREEFA